MNPTKGEGGEKSPLAGMAFLFAAQFFSSTQYAIQEKLVKSYNVNSFQLVGFEGLWGASVYTLMLVFSRWTVGHGLQSFGHSA